MNIEPADRVKQLPPYLFAEIDAMKREVKKRGIDVLDFGVGDPDLPTPDFIVKALQEAFQQQNYHRYPSYSGSNEFRCIIAEWFKNRFSVSLDPEKEIIVLIGSKEGIAHTPLALVNPRDKVLYTSPGYPVYKIATQFAGGTPVPVPLKIENHFLPDLDKIPTTAKLFFLNYPNNPTSANAPLSYFEKLVSWAQKTDTILCHDAAYSEIYFGEEPTHSLLEAPNAKAVTLEFHSLSKTFNMTGWRIGFAVGNAKLISALGKMKTNIDSGQFIPIQRAAGAALQKGETFIQAQRTLFKSRREQLVETLRQTGIEVYPSDATFYVWAKTPKGQQAMTFCATLLNELGIVTTPGIGFGAEGEGYFRFSLTVPDAQLAEARRRLKKLK